MPLYEFRCSKCNKIDSVMCTYDSLKDKIPECCEQPMLRNYGVGGYVIHDCETKGLKHARVSMGGSPPRNTTKEFSTSVYEPGDNKTHSYSRYYLKNNPSQDPRLVEKKMESN